MVRAQLASGRGRTDPAARLPGRLRDDELAVLELQRAAGNRAVATAATQGPAAPPAVQRLLGGQYRPRLVQRACSCGGTCSSCRDDEIDHGLPGIQRDLLDEADEWASGAVDAVGSVADTVTNTAIDTYEDAARDAGRGYEAASAGYEQAATQVGETADQVTTTIAEGGDDPVGAAGQAWDQASAGAGKLADTVADTAGEVGEAALDVVDDVATGVDTAAGEVRSAVGSWLSGDPGSEADGGVPNRKLGDTPGSRTPNLTPGTEESEDYDPSLLCVLKQAGRVIGDADSKELLEFYAEKPDENMYADLAQKFGICAISKCSPPGVTVQLILHAYFVDEPHAKQNLRHYIAGSGQDLPQDMPSFLSDPGVHAKLSMLIGRDYEKDDTDPYDFAKGPIQQADYKTTDWFNALGGVDFIRMTVLTDAASRAANRAAPGTALVKVELRDPYQWHPGEVLRPTQCLHELFEAMKLNGAAEYNAVGVGVAQLDLPAAKIPT